MEEKRSLVHLDLLRAGAAFVVLCYHARLLFFVSYSKVRWRDALITVLYFLTSLGHQAVMVFFVLSGFLVAGSAIRAYKARRWSLGWYFRNRLTRLYIVLIPGLALGGIWDRFGLSFFGANGIYSGRNNHLIYFAVFNRLSSLTFVGNVLFLQTIAVPPLGSNLALWSLSNEFWYYVAFALLLTAATAGQIRTRLIALVAVGLLFFSVGRSISLYFLPWLAGAALNFAPATKRSQRLLLAIAAAALMISLLLIDSLPRIPSDFLVCGASCLLIYSLLQFGGGYAGPGIASRLAGMSYTLYLIHLPFLVFVAAIVANKSRWQPDAIHIVFSFAIIALAFSYALLVAQYTEMRTDVFRAWLKELPESRYGWRSGGGTPARRRFTF